MLTLEKQAEYQKEIQTLKDNSRVIIETELKKLDDLERLVYNYVFHNVFLDEDIESLLKDLRKELRNTEPIQTPTSTYNYISGWVRGRIDAVKGNKKVDDESINSAFIREVVDLVKPNKLIDVHINVLCEYVYTQSEILTIKGKYHEQQKQ